MTAAKDTPLFAEFENVSRDAWVAAIEKSLRGRSLDSLTKRTYEGIDQSPIATVDDLEGISDCGNLPGQYPYLRGTRAAGYLADGLGSSRRNLICPTRRLSIARCKMPWPRDRQPSSSARIRASRLLPIFKRRWPESTWVKCRFSSLTMPAP